MSVRVCRNEVARDSIVTEAPRLLRLSRCVCAGQTGPTLQNRYVRITTGWSIYRCEEADVSASEPGTRAGVRWSRGSAALPGAGFEELNNDRPAARHVRAERADDRRMSAA
jgi:hypothetical protein